MKVRRVDFYPDDWIAGTVGLSHIERSVYISVIAGIWAVGGPVPMDYLRRICPGRGMEKGLRGLVEKGKVSLGGSLTVQFVSQTRALAELSRSTSRIEQAHENGAKGGRPNNLAKPDGSTDRKANSHTVNSQQPDSVAIATGDGDPVKQLWDRGLVIVGKHNRALLGKLCKQHGNVVVMEAIVFTEQETRADPLSFLLGYLKHTKEINGHGGKQSPGEKLYEGAYRAALAYDARQRVGQPLDDPLLDGERPGGDAASTDRGLDRGLSRVSH